ncbi:cupredoxin domain-containing protein [Nisaea denitrificans]|uniref:cupredoxin domain-containing protein n=1 Tax=Nisaea denitrificans TaxID=390877 RepID=UPI000428ADCC|nr:cupredoxin domain-containing protein [Nisaea denitrificans]
MSSSSILGAVLGASLSFALLSSGPALAAGSHGGGHGMHDMKIGKPGDPAKVSRTIEITMYDNYYEPESLDIKEGETIRFVVRNAGEFVHEFNIATAAMHEAHRPEMMMMMEHGVLEPDRINLEAAKAMQASMGHGMHNEANSVLLEPGKSGEIVWTFPKHADLEFACNVPGHYETGMHGKVKLSH